MRLTSKGWPRALALQDFRYHRYDIDYDMIGHVIDYDIMTMISLFMHMISYMILSMI
jgi:hypothetical protein